MMSANNKLLREGIISKLKDYDAYVDNELPDYIMVMLANNKTVHQINNDLQLFLGANTDRFTEWLQDAMNNPSVLTETVSEQKKKEEGGGETGVKGTGGPSPALAGSKRKRNSNVKEEEEGEIELEDYEEDDGWDDEGPPTPPLEEVAAAMAKAEQKRRTERERGRERGGSPVKVMKISTDDASSEGQRSHVIVKKVIRVLQPPDSSRDQDLRELIAQRRKEKAHQQELAQRKEGSQREEDSEGEDASGHTSSIASVVKLVHTERPQRSDKGGSRLLHKAILGIKSDGGKRSLRGQERSSSGSGKERVEQVQPTRSKVSTSSKRTSSTAVQSSERDLTDPVAGGESVEEVLVEVAEEGAMTEEGASFVDEFRQEQQEEKAKSKIFKDAIEKTTLAAVKKVLPLDRRLRLTDSRTTKNNKVKRLSAIARLGERKEEEEKGGDGEERSEESETEVDLREIINKKSKKNIESSNSTRFVVTLAGAGDEYTHNTTSDLDEEEKEVEKAEVMDMQKVLNRNRRFNRQAVVEAAASIRDVAVREDEEEPVEYEEDRQGGRGLSGLPERCRFWPNCKNGDSCPFHHPSVACRLFPNCKYGNKCHFIHPQCKFDARCTRADCPYLHTAPRHLAFPPSVMTPPTAPPTIIPQPVFSPFNSTFAFNRASPWQPTRPQRYPNKSALSWTPGKTSHISERPFAVSEDQTSSLPV